MGDGVCLPFSAEALATGLFGNVLGLFRFCGGNLAAATDGINAGAAGAVAFGWFPFKLPVVSNGWPGNKTEASSPPSLPSFILRWMYSCTVMLESGDIVRFQ